MGGGLQARAASGTEHQATGLLKGWLPGHCCREPNQCPHTWLKAFHQLFMLFLLISLSPPRNLRPRFPSPRSPLAWHSISE